MSPLTAYLLGALFGFVAGGLFIAALVLRRWSGHHHDVTRVKIDGEAIAAMVRRR